MQVVSLSQIQPLLSLPQAIAAVKAGFIQHARGLVMCPEPMQILFHSAQGALQADCHVKSAYRDNLGACSSSDTPYFVIKVASGFYRNPEQGLPVNNGHVMVMCARTGQALAILQDQGWLTAQRTAAAGALAAALKPLESHQWVGVLGTGLQAELQALAIHSHMTIAGIRVYGRNPKKAQALCAKLLAQGITAVPEPDIRSLCHHSATVVTTTPATAPVITVEHLPESLHIVAVGADSPGKSEICPQVFATATQVVTDDHQQCLAHGDFGNAVAAGTIDADADRSLGDCLTCEAVQQQWPKQGVTIVDLTGVGVQDLAVASEVMRGLENQTAALGVALNA